MADNISKIKLSDTIYTLKDSDAIHNDKIGVANGVASLDANGLVPKSQLPVSSHQVIVSDTEPTSWSVDDEWLLKY